MFCRSCGSKIENDTGFCTQCGISIGSESSGSETKKNVDLPPKPHRSIDGALNIPNSDPVVVVQSAVSPLITGFNSASAKIQESHVIDRISKLLINPMFFVIGYTVFMIPTYFLPYLGSNSSILNAAGAATGVGMNPLLWIHVAALAGLVLISWLRGKLINKNWLGTLPFAALLFDLLPGLSMIPLVPTVLHVVTIVLGVKDDAMK